MPQSGHPLNEICGSFSENLESTDNFLVRRAACHLDLISPNAAFCNLTGIVSDDYGQLFFRNLKAQIVAARAQYLAGLPAYALVIELAAPEPNASLISSLMILPVVAGVI